MALHSETGRYLHDFDAVRVPFREIEDLLPPDCWAVERNKGNEGELNDEIVLFYDQSLALETLDLENPVGNGEVIFLIFVRGDLRVSATISNPHSDGASGLIVTGNVVCQNAIVGGQQIYIDGNFTVGQLFWGDYNHGDIVVNGSASAGMAITTEAYRVRVRGDRHFDRCILDETPGGDGWRLGDQDALAQFIKREFINPYDGSLSRDEMLDALAEGKSVIVPAPLYEDDIAMSAMFGDQALNEANILLASSPKFLLPGGPDEWLGAVECRTDADLFRVVRCCANSRTPVGSLYFERQDSYAVLVETCNSSLPLFDRLRLKWNEIRKDLTYPQLRVRWRHGSPNNSWRHLKANAPMEVHGLLDTGWSAVRRFASSRRCLSDAIAPADLKALLALAVVEPYDDFDSSDRDGLWLEDTLCRFRQPDAQHGVPALLHVTVETDGSHQFFYELALAADGTEFVEVRFHEDPNLETAPVQVAWIGRTQLERSIAIFRLAKRNLLRANERLLAGERISRDAFAITHWRKKGYLKGRLPG